MKYSEILAHINQLITEISRLNGIIQENQHKPGKINLDLLLKKVPELYDDLLNLTSQPIPLQEETETAPLPPVEEKPEPVPVPETPSKDIEITFEPETPAVPEEVKEEEIVEEITPPGTKEAVEAPEIEPVKEEKTIPKPTETGVKADVAVVDSKPEIKIPQQPSLFDTPESSISPDAKKSVFEKFAKTETSVNEKIAHQKQVPLSEKVKKTPISDIKSAINLNLKLAFIKELFNNDQKEYKRLIDFIQKCGNYSEAKLFFQGEIDKHPSWNNHQELVDTLMELIERRFR